MEIEGIAPAKINLCLHLTGLRDDGYHLLDSLVVFSDFGDVLTVAPAPDLSLRVSGPFAEGVPDDGRNLVLKAAALLRDLRGVSQGAEIRLEKHLPHGGGIGGGSSDAACAIRLLAELWQVAPLTGDEAVVLGADVPVCLSAPRPMRMRGIGEVLAPGPDLPPFWLVLVNPGVHVDTRRAFALHDALHDGQSDGRGLDPLPVASDRATFLDWLSAHGNDFTRVICEGGLAPVVAEVLEALRAAEGCARADMSGSGSTCWGLFFEADKARAAAERLTGAHADWWVRPTRIS